MTTDHSSFKSKGGIARVLAATRYSINGFKAALTHEAAFRQELAIGVPLIGVALWFGKSPMHIGLMIFSIILVWIVELLNSAIEALADAISVEQNPMLGRAKDLGSAAVFCAISAAVLIWFCALVF